MQASDPDVTDRPAPRPLAGAEKAALVLMCLGEEVGVSLMQSLDEAELRRIGTAMSALGRVPVASVEAALREFGDAVATGGTPGDGRSAARRMLGAFLTDAEADALLERTDAPRRERAAWRRLADVEPTRIAGALRDEPAQSVAAILAHLPPKTAAAVYPLLAPERRHDVIARMTGLGTYPAHLLDDIELAVQEDLLASAEADGDGAAHEVVADLLSALGPDDRHEALDALDRTAAEAAAGVRDRMFTFDDMIRIDARGLARLMREVEGTVVPTALAGTHDTMREHFLSALPARSRGMLEREIAQRDAPTPDEGQEAQRRLVEAAKTLLRADDIAIAKRGG